MPRLLLQRCRHDCVADFRAAAQRRRAEAELLASSGFGTGAIYLRGYSVEMLLNAAFFRLMGNGSSGRIALEDLKTAQSLEPGWAGNLHHIEWWSRLLVRTRAELPGFNYADKAFGRTLVAKGQRLHGLWREFLRYRPNNAYPFEVRTVRDIADWFASNQREL